MEQQLFRKKSVERISSPEELHDYMRVTSPRLWIVLVAIVVLLAGFIVYASMARMENTLPIKMELFELVDEDEGIKHTAVSSTLPYSQMGLLEPGMRVRLGEEEGTVTYIYTDDQGNAGIIMHMDKEYLPLPSGIYDGVLVLESVTPISFLMN